jgi:hypothetical protein
LVSENLAISNVKGLQSALANTISNPFKSTIEPALDAASEIGRPTKRVRHTYSQEVRTGRVGDETYYMELGTGLALVSTSGNVTVNGSGIVTEMGGNAL